MGNDALHDIVRDALYNEERLFTLPQIARALMEEPSHCTPGMGKALLARIAVMEAALRPVEAT